MIVGKFDSIFKQYQENCMENQDPRYADYGIIEEDFETMRPYLEMAYELGKEISK